MKTGIVDVGGGLRGIYAAGYLTGASTRRFCLTCASAFRPEAQTWFLILRDKGEKLPLLCGILFQKEIHGDREIPVEAFLY